MLHDFLWKHGKFVACVAEEKTSRDLKNILFFFSVAMIAHLSPTDVPEAARERDVEVG